MHTKLKIIVSSLAAVVAVFTGSGCASIVKGGPGKIAVNSQPAGAIVTVYDAHGTKVSSVATPTVLELKRGAGYFKSASYRLVIAKDGYRPTEVQITGSVNGWYWGNIIFGGLIGMLVVDPLTGSMYTLAPKQVDEVLAATNAGISREDGGLVIVLREDLPAGLDAALQPLVAN